MMYLYVFVLELETMLAQSLRNSWRRPTEQTRVFLCRSFCWLFGQKRGRKSRRRLETRPTGHRRRKWQNWRLWHLSAKRCWQLKWSAASSQALQQDRHQLTRITSRSATGWPFLTGESLQIEILQSQSLRSEGLARSRWRQPRGPTVETFREPIIIVTTVICCIFHCVSYIP